MGSDTTSTVNWVRSITFVSLGIVFLSIVTSFVAYGRLGETVRIRWTVGTYPQYGPQHAPTILVLTAFPVILAGLFLGASALRTYLERTQNSQELDRILPILNSCILLILGIVLVSQLGLILFNL